MEKLTVGAVAAAMWIALAPALPAAAVTTDEARVLLLGDSVTHGFEGEYTWRYFADGSIGDRVDFVGPHTGTWSDEDQFGGAYADPDFDTDHAARFGLSMFETLYYSSESAPSVPDLMVSAPEVLVLTLGFNDLVGVNQTPGNTIDHARNIIGQAREANPDVDVVLFSLPQVWFDRVPAYNALLPGLATELSTEASQVVVTPLAQLENRVDTYDDSHPNTQGQEKIAAAVVSGLAELGLSSPEPVDPPTSTPPAPTPTPTQTPEPATPTPAPAPDETTAPAPSETPLASPTVPPAATQPKAGAPKRVKVRRAGGRMIVTWRAGSDAERSVVRCGRVQKVTAGQRARLRARTTFCKVRSVNDAGTSRWVRSRAR